ncbi:zinc ribbon domain-containing protein [Bifidobacterium parmae]|uniref:Zinc-ribbon domain-containing protein n=1 Tax=Bifidobacterium parmae TaxID=361854 RepID=A0A2N5J660_9BIFI|nr:zinc ribbon domain-containing protein [Bifidobacterium parmae]PLS29688.1 hypothetical protein Uis4E_0029 [Bifidobacterium parmae]
MICPHCNAANQPNAKFCALCGQPIAAQTTSPQSTQTMPTMQPTQPAYASYDAAYGTAHTAPQQTQSAYATTQPTYATTQPAPAGITDDDFDRLNRTWTLKQVLLERGLFPFIFGIVGCLFIISSLPIIQIITFIPAFLVSLLVGTILMRIWLTLTKATHAEPEIVEYCRRSGIDPHELTRPVWYAQYGTIIGFFALGFIGYGIMMATGNVPLSFIAYPIAWLLIRALNKYMFAHTQANTITIAAVQAGCCDGLFHDEGEKTATLKRLESRNYGTVRAALDAARSSRSFTKLGVIGGAITAVGAFLLFRPVDKAVQDEIRLHRDPYNVMVEQMDRDRRNRR